jgi:hypothetical protein
MKMKWLLKCLPLFMLALVLPACSSHSSNNLFSLRGFVQSGATHNVLQLKGAQVKLFEATSSQPVMIGQAISDASGRFTITSDRSTSDSIFYVTATLGGGVVLAAVLGPSLPAQATINELTTVAFSYSMAQFLDNGALRGNAFGLRIAAGMNNNIVNVSTGDSSPVLLSSPNADETNALRLTRALANLAAACVRNGKNDCDTLFALATPPGGSMPADIVQALFDIAHNPANNVGGIYSQSNVLEIYSRSLESQPDAWTIAVKVNDSGDDNFLFGGLGNLVFDYRGYAWITNNVVQGTTGSSNWAMVLKPDGSPSDGTNGTPLSPIMGGGLLGGGFGICKDTQGFIWLSNFGWGGVNPTPSGSASEFDLSGQPLSPPDGFQGGVYRVQGIESDQANNIWLASLGNNRVVVYPGGDADNSVIFQGDDVFLPFGIAIAADGSAWVTNANPIEGSISRFELVDGTITRTFHKLLGKELKGVVVDPLGNVWTSGGADDTVYALTGDGTVIGGFTGVGGMKGPWGLAVDGDDNIWVADFGATLPGDVLTGRLTALAGANAATRPAGLNMGDPITPPTGYTLPSAGSQVLLHNGVPLYGVGAAPSFIPMMRTTGLAIDQAGNVWTVNNWKPDFDIDITSNPGGDGVVIFVGLAKPPRTQLPSEKCPQPFGCPDSP